jgi:hypothetical protein
MASNHDWETTAVIYKLVIESRKLTCDTYNLLIKVLAGEHQQGRVAQQY